MRNMICKSDNVMIFWYILFTCTFLSCFPKTFEKVIERFYDVIWITGLDDQNQFSISIFVWIIKPVFLWLGCHVTQSIKGLSHIGTADTRAHTYTMSRSQKTDMKTTTATTRGRGGCHYCRRLTHSVCILERTIRICQSNEPHEVSTNRTDGDLDREGGTSNTEGRGDKPPSTFSGQAIYFHYGSLTAFLYHSALGALLLIGLWATGINSWYINRPGSTLLTCPR